jgi:hypothetical protein
VAEEEEEAEEGGEDRKAENGDRKGEIRNLRPET